ncbi:MAG: methyl-accepting chemotaxis protein, partial [Deltaproteobacteria bacterium]|nr:methyl-accepting chemotaxis protein [Deltaproteobacteria bacterium]
MSLRNVKIGTRISLGFGAILLLVALTYGGILMGVRRVAYNAEQVETESMPFALLADELVNQTVQVQQFLTDASLTGSEESVGEAEKAAAGFFAGIEKFGGMYRKENDAEGLRRMQDLKGVFARFQAGGKAMAQAYQKGGAAAGNRLMGEFDKAAEELTQKVHELQSQQIEEAKANMVGIATAVGRVTTAVFASLVGVLALGLLIAFFITRSVTVPLGTCLEVARRVARGDTSVAIDASGKDETGRLLAAMGEMVQTIGRLTAEMLGL